MKTLTNLYQPSVRLSLTVCLVLLLLPAVVGAEESKTHKKVENQDFSFQYPTGWNYSDLGKDDFDGMTGYTMALGAPDGLQCSVVVMIFPDFSLDLDSVGFTFADFSKMVLESYLEEEKATDLKIEETECKMSHGEVNSFIAEDTSNPDIFKTSLICADKKEKRAAIVIITTDFQKDSEEAELRIEEAEKIVESIIFPK